MPNDLVERRGPDLAAPQPIRNGAGADIIGPRNVPREAENPDVMVSPATDHGTLPNLRWSFADSRMRLEEGGWARQTTLREFGVAREIAGVNMRLKRGAVRELHFHREAEWAYILKGRARISAVERGRKTFLDDVGEGDLWFFAAGVPHSIQGIGDDGCEFLLVFDDGMFSEFETFLITDWLHHTPKEVLAKNFGLPESTFDIIPNEELYIFNAPLPGSLQSDQREMDGEDGPVPNPFTYELSKQKPDFSNKSGEVKIVDSTRFKASTAIAAAQVTLRPGGLRELHWHPNADEWQYYVKGQGRMTVFTGGGKARTMDFKAGDVGYIPNNLPHYIENTGDTDLVFLETFKADEYQDISLTEWITHLPATLVKAHLGIDKETLLANGKGHQVVVPA